ncbi:MAG: molybdopterin molybdotransferase MoeA [Rhodopirellula sp.]|nr:molybdopterin molybdotransferase MoeA [Rhodopirellula sp.]
MRGFRSRTSVEDALRWIDANVFPLNSEAVTLGDAHGRVLASGITSPIDVPAFDRSAMDGFAVKSAETVGAGDYNPLPFRIVGVSMPGQPFEGVVERGEAVRIMTGAPIPHGVDAVVPAEYATVREGSVEITTTVASLKHIGRTAEDVAAGATVLAAGHRLRPQDVGLIASLGLPAVSAVRQPRVRIVVTGNELAEPGSERGPFQIYESNSHIIAGLVPRDDGVLFERIRCQDDRESILAAVTNPGADVVLISGGSSVGTEDHAPNIIREVGELPIHGVAMRPSSPAGIGRIGATLIFLLPGNPVSCLCAYDFFAGRAIRRLAGRNPDWPHRTEAGTLKSKIVSQVGRVDYCRVRINDGRIEPVALSGASILSSTTRANGFVIVPSALEGYAAGTEVEVRLYS